ncbi:polysaccharide deacetylase family protein [Microbacterium excoecariae]|uniref:polysaccharide deacetylase family protein n=1 Tax=Microbacterium excoecariae TaxID=2715210 RepID=UPI00140C047B|nr:polysaccharide deacetylase family protein [Microbacterium excoecariae]NHI17672.1 polysaccharide deacetylase family protein [Microbacterium excoecariae]
MTLIDHPADAMVFAPDLPRAYDAHRDPLALPGGKKLAVSVLLHAPSYQDDVPAGSVTPLSMAGGVGRDTSEPRHGQVARLSQWDFGLTTGIWRLLDIAERAGVPVAVALDEYGARTVPGLAREVALRAQEVVARGTAANILLAPGMTEDEEARAIAAARDAVTGHTGREVAGWFSPERSMTPRTTRLLREAGFSWFGDWPIDERPVALGGASGGLTALPHPLETEDMFVLYGRSATAATYERILEETVDQLVADADVTGARTLGLSWFGWVLGQACYADVAERTLAALAAHPDILLVTPGEAAAL